MDVLSLETLDEANHFLALCKQNSGYFDQWTHIGAITLYPKSTNSWYWVNSGKRVTYHLRFGPGQPDNAGGRELCLSIGKDPQNFFFNDLNCYGSHEFKFICQKHLANVVFWFNVLVIFIQASIKDFVMTFYIKLREFNSCRLFIAFALKWTDNENVLEPKPQLLPFMLSFLGFFSLTTQFTIWNKVSNVSTLQSFLHFESKWFAELFS